MRRVLLYLYPAAWRERYGDEFSAILEERRPGLRQTLDIVRGALDARIRPRFPRESIVSERRIAMAFAREELRNELHAIMAAREELGPEHEQHLVEGFLDRLEGHEAAPETQSARRPGLGLWAALLAGAIAAAGGAIAVVQHDVAGVTAQSKPLPTIDRIDADVPSPLLRLPLNHFTSRTAPALFGYAFVSDYHGPHPYAFINFDLRYQGCQITPHGAFHLTIEREGYRVTRYSPKDGRIFIARTGPLTRWTEPTVFWERSLAATLMFPAPTPGLYYWKVEVPSVRGCAWRIDYNGT